MPSQIKEVGVFLFFCLISISVFGQSGKYIQGKVFDSITKEPIAFSFILLNQNKFGIIANEEGDFKINTYSYFISDTLKISCIGYETKSVKFKSLSPKLVNDIYLNPSITSLKEVEIIALRKKISAKKLIKRAIKNIPKNYPVDSFSTVSYYRDYQKKDKEYLNLNEAIIHSSDNGFETDKSLNNYRLLDYKKNLSFKRNDIELLYDTLNTPNYENPNKFIPNAFLPNQGGNELFILMAHDPIRNYKTNSFSFINIFSKDLLYNHTFSKPEPVYNDDLLLLKVKFKTKNWIEYGLIGAFGEIFIQPYDYSIHKINYTCIDNKTKQEIFNFKIEYGYTEQMNSIMKLKYISFNNVFNLIDVNGTALFNLINIKIIQQKNSYIEIKMTNLVDENSVNNKDQFVVYGNGRRLKVGDIHVRDSSIIVSFKDKNYSRITYKIYPDNFRDIDGRFINQKKTLKYHQFRELFVQEYNSKIKFKDSCHLTNKPISYSCISKFYGENKYWMNTPMVIKNENK